MSASLVERLGGASRLLHRTALLTHLTAAVAALVAGVGHTLSIRGKLASGLLPTVTEVRLDVLYLIGLALVASGLLVLATWVSLFRSPRSRWARRAAGVELFTVLWICLAFLEPRGLPLTLAPLLDLGVLMALARRAAPS